MGFKDLEKFNQALLAKQAARVLNNPESLLARILKQQYFKNGSFIDCGMGSRPSFAWRSILHGRELLKQGLMTRIGNGSETKVWWDRWIVDGVPWVPEYIQGSVVDLTLKVEDLIDQQSRVWNRSLVYDTFSQKDAEIILKLKLNLSRSDKVVWGFTKNGAYSSMSVYELLDTLEDLSSPSAASIPRLEKQLWQALWKTKTSPKLCHFL